MMRRLALALIAALLCAAVNAQPGSAGRRVGVLVLAGHELRLLQIGALVFGNAYGRVAVPDGRLADAIYEGLRADLAREPGQSVHRVELPFAELQRLGPLAYEGSSGFWGASLDALRPELARLGAGCQCDTLLVVSSRKGIEVLQTNQTAPGLTWIRTVGRQGILLPLSLYRVDPASGRPLADVAIESDLAAVEAAWPAEPAKATQLAEGDWTALARAAERGLRPREAEVTAKIHSAPLGLSRLGLRPSCAMVYYQLTTTARQRDPGFANHVPPPVVDAGADPSTCPVRPGPGT